MPTTLTLGGSGFASTLYNTTQNFIVTDNSTPTDTITFAGVPNQATFWNGNNTATLAADPGATINKVTLDFGSGSDTLTVSNALLGDTTLTPTNDLQAKIVMGGGSDSLTINNSLERYRVSMLGGNDTVVINESVTSTAIDLRQVRIDLGAGADSLVVNADMRNTTIVAGNSAVDGADTIVIRAGIAAHTNNQIVNFSVSGDEDVLIIRSGINQFTFSADDYNTIGVYSSGSLISNLTPNADIDAVNAWLSLGNTISLI